MMPDSPFGFINADDDSRSETDSSSDSVSCTSGSASSVPDTDAADLELANYLGLLKLGTELSAEQSASWGEEIRTSPLFTWPVKKTLASALSMNKHASESLDRASQANGTIDFEQYAVIGSELATERRPVRPLDNRPIFLNTNAPWSAFLCGSQGSGKSYTLSCILENCLMKNQTIGKNPNPLAGIVFAYDAHSAGIACEAAHLPSHLPVRILVSPSNYRQMKSLYESLPETKGRVTVFPLLLKSKHLNTERMLRMMAFDTSSDSMPLYLEVIVQILKEIAITGEVFSYEKFVAKIEEEKFLGTQAGPLKLRLLLLDSFMDRGRYARNFPKTKADIFQTHPGELTIVDLTDPFMDPGSACVLFDLCLALFLENRSSIGKVIALDEAHKLMSESAASSTFTDSLLTVIREQRHKGCRIVIATQEPTVSHKLLDLCTMTFVHRFTSPNWLKTLKDHLAGASMFAEDSDSGTSGSSLFADIVSLNVGESLLFSPNAMLDVTDGKAVKLGASHVKFKTRPRLTKDGGKSIMAV